MCRCLNDNRVNKDFTLSGGKTANCEITPIESNVYTEEDYKAGECSRKRLKQIYKEKY